MVIVDTLIGAARFADDGRIFKYSQETRSDLADVLIKRADSINIDFEFENSKKEPKKIRLFGENIREAIKILKSKKRA